MLLFIVAREATSQFEYLKRAFSGEESVRVIVDRRVRDRRARPDAWTASERRRGERRARPHLDHELQTVGWALIR